MVQEMKSLSLCPLSDSNRLLEKIAWFNCPRQTASRSPGIKNANKDKPRSPIVDKFFYRPEIRAFEE
jgi:hypothetical protein